MRIEALEGRDVPAVVFTDTYTWAVPGTSNAATVEVTVEDDAPGYAGQYLWTYRVTNTGFTGATGSDIGIFAVSVGEPDDVTAMGNSMGWDVSVGQFFGDPTLVAWQGGEFTDNLGSNESADFWFVTSETGVQLTTGVSFAADSGFALTTSGPVAAPAPGLLVTTAQDVVDKFDGETSLREAVAEVNDNPNNLGGVWKIKFKSTLAGATITLKSSGDNSGQITIGKSVSIDGSGQGITVQRNPNTTTQHRLFEVASSKLARFNGLTLQNGKLDLDAGAAILSRGSLVIQDCTFKQNEATGSRGGAVAVLAGTLRVYGSTFTGNTARSGGAIYIETTGTVSLSGTSLVLNTATERGGGLYIYSSPSVTLSGVDVNGNQALDRGAGIYVHNPSGAGTTLTLTGSTTIQNNVLTSATGKGGGVYFGKGTIELNGVSFIKNTASQGDGLFRVTGTTKTVGSGGVTFDDDIEAVGSA